MVLTGAYQRGFNCGDFIVRTIATAIEKRGQGGRIEAKQLAASFVNLLSFHDGNVALTLSDI